MVNKFYGKLIISLIINTNKLRVHVSWFGSPQLYHVFILYMMIRRPTVGETENDLLALQKSFFASTERPSASLITANSFRAGEKRRRKERDVVQLEASQGKFKITSIQFVTIFMSN